MTTTKLRVTEGFDAKHATSRAREKFGKGELLMLLDGSGSPEHSRFMRINGLRPHRGVEVQYIIESTELNEKTETFVSV